LIRKKIPDFTLTVYGDGPFRDRVKGEGIILKGENPFADKEIPKYEYAFVSRYLAILEAMAAKRLVVAHYDNPVKKDYLELTPYKDWIITSRFASDVAKKVINLKDKEKDIMIEKSFSWVKDQTWEKLASGYHTLWNLN